MWESTPASTSDKTRAGDVVRAAVLAPAATAVRRKGECRKTVPAVSTHRSLVKDTGWEGLIRPRWYGLGEDYCTAPDCQLNYGSGCDGNQKPSGIDTSKIARPKPGRIPYGGVGIYDCVINGDIALTFDDGPYDYTGDLLDKLAVRGRGHSPT